MGLSNANTMLNGIAVLANGGYWWMSILVLFCAILAPFLKLLSLLIVSAGCLFKWRTSVIVFSLKAYQYLEEWGMFDVYMLGILVSYIKMQDMGVLIAGQGLLFFTILLLVATLCSVAFDPQSAWEKIDERNVRPTQKPTGTAFKAAI